VRFSLKHFFSEFGMTYTRHTPHLIMPFPLSIHAQEKQRARTGLVVLASSFLAAVALLAFLNEYSEPALQIDALELKDGFTVAQIGQYGMRADRQARNFEQGDAVLCLVWGGVRVCVCGGGA
jgi:hypothetical protein